MIALPTSFALDLLPLVEANYPNLVAMGYALTSEKTSDYNCIAWAAGDEKHWWWPDPVALANHDVYWPPNVPCRASLPDFIAAYATRGYVPCDGEAFEPGFEKVAVFIDADGTPTHAALQLGPGVWTSKLGQNKDISHPLEAVAGQRYGTVASTLRRVATAPTTVHRALVRDFKREQDRFTAFYAELARLTDGDRAWFAERYLVEFGWQLQP